MELLRLLRGREISSVELAEEHIREIERLDPSLHAFAHFDPERALLAAQAADEQHWRDFCPAAGSADDGEGFDLNGVDIGARREAR